MGVGQSPPSTAEAPNPVPVSPTAASLGKYGNTPINLHSGMVQVNVPLHEIKFNDFTYPISLNHAYNGLKVEEYPSWVGTGWTLTAAGSISRQVRGLPDENPDGYNGANQRGYEAYRYAGRKPPYNSILGQAEVLLANVVANRWDAEPDLFTFNCGSYSGKFYFDVSQSSTTEKRGRTVPYDGLDITGYFDYFGNNLNGRITRFVVKDRLGVTFTFDEQEESELAEPGDDQVPAYVSTWFLTEIITPNNHRITFTYDETGLVQMPPTISQHRYIPMAHNGALEYEIDHPDPVLNISSSMTRESTLRRIDFDYGSVEFIDGPDREDWPLLSGDLTLPNVLGAVRINDHNGSELKRFDFAYTMFPRLFLDKITVQVGSAREKLYEFEYVNKAGAPIIPGPEFGWEVLYHQDHWGYFNGNLERTLLPSYDALLTDQDGSTQVIRYPGGDRSPDDNSRVGLLERVIYPTGGYSEFVYEPNEYKLPPLYSYFDPCSVPKQTLQTLNATTEQSLWEFSLTGTSCLEFRYTLQLRCLSEIWVSVHDLSRSQSVLLKKLTSGGGIPAEELGSYQIVLPAGNYSVAAYADAEDCQAGQQNSVEVEVIGAVDVPEQPGDHLVRRGGGYRIAVARDCPGSAGEPCITKKYTYQSSLDGLTSGVLINPPVYTYRMSKYHQLEGNQNLVSMGIVVPYEFQGTQSQVPLGTASGNYVGYGTVTQWEGLNGENGKTVYSYSTAREYPDIIKNEFPFPPAESRDYRRGKLLSESVYANVDGEFRLISQTNNVYSSDPEHHVLWDTVGFKFGRVVETPVTDADPRGEYEFVPYRISCDWWKLTGTETKEYSYNADGEPAFLRSAQSTLYDPAHLQVTETESTDSEGRRVVTKFLYPESPLDVFPPSPLDPTGYGDLLNKGISAQKVGEIAYVDGSLSRISRTFFKSFGNVVQPERIQESVNGATPTARLVFHEYDSDGNIVRFSKPQGSHTSFDGEEAPAFPLRKR
jgi:hypothetical protein